MAQRRGADFRVSIDGFFYAVNRIGVSGQVNDIVTSNTEGIAGNPERLEAWLFTTTRIPDLPDGEISLVSATFDDAHNPFAAVPDLKLGAYYDVQAYPAGIAGGIYYDWGNCLL